MQSQNAHKYCSFKKHPEYSEHYKSIPANKVPYREHELSKPDDCMSKIKTRIAKILKGRYGD